MDGQAVKQAGNWTAMTVFAVAVLGFLWNIQSSMNDVRTELGQMRSEIGGLRERTARIEVRLDFIAEPPATVRN